jgi:putative phage-type endonuclease
MAAPKALCDTSGMSRERWLECRAHGPDGNLEYTIGGSDVSAVLGENPWVSPLELWQTKKGLLKPDDSGNVSQKEMGHLMEPVIAHWYGKLTGSDIIADSTLYQHAGCPYALANLDYLFAGKTGDIGVLECKMTNWHNADNWADGAVPPYYELQVRFYLAVMDMETADIACMWGLNPETDMAVRRITRNRATEALIFERLGAFIESLRMGNPPSMAGVDPELAMKALARVYAASKPEPATIEFGAKYEGQLLRIVELQSENSGLERQIKANETEAAALSVKIAEAMKGHEHGVLETPKGLIMADWAARTARRPDSALLKKEYADVYEAVLKTMTSRKLKVSIRKK